MERASKSSWLDGPGDLETAEVEDVPVPGQSVLVRGLPAVYSAEIQSKLTLETRGRQQVATVDIPTMERLQFLHGVVEPAFTPDEALVVQAKYGPAFQKVIAKIDELSGINKEAVAETEARFQDGGDGSEGRSNDAVASGNGQPGVPARAGA
jgi:uncharacterized protein (DUF1684 family)